jgi:hypothetical protein
VVAVRTLKLMPILLILSAGCAPTDEVVDFAHVDSGTTVHAVSEGVNPPPYDVRAAIGDGSHLSYPGALPNWFELDLGQTRSITAIEIDRRYADKGPDDFDISFGMQPGEWGRTIEVRGVGAREGRHWFRILDEPVTARFVRLEVTALHDYGWTVVNRFSLYGTGRIPRLVEENAERYAWLSDRLGRLSLETADAISTVPQALLAATAEAAEYATLLEDDDRQISEAQWLQMDQRFRTLQDRAYDAEARLSFTRLRPATDAPALVAAVGAMTQVFRHVWPGDAASERLELSCARNERESGQVVLAALEGDLTGVEVSVDPLDRAGHARGRRRARADLLRAHPRAPTARQHHVGLWPDGISPLAAFDLPAGEVQPIWLTVAIPRTLPAGTYSTAVHIRAEGLPGDECPVSVTVWDFALPDRVSLPNVFSVSSQLVDAWYRGQKLGLGGRPQGRVLPLLAGAPAQPHLALRDDAAAG